MKKRRAGYSLLEVLVAFAILMMVLATVLPGKSASLKRLADGDAAFLAQDYALSRLDRFVVAEWPSDPSPKVSTETYLDWTVRVSAETVDPGTLIEWTGSGERKGLALLSVEVFGDTEQAPLGAARRYLALRETEGGLP